MTMPEPNSSTARAPRISIPFAVLMLLGAVGLYYGWRTFWFLTDDAFIEFRYVSNSINGYGYVWNASPFLPVEGYTSFLWVVLLGAVWRALGIEPPQSANVISLAFSYGSLLLAALMMVRIPWRPEWKRFRMAFVALLLIGTLSNRTFLTWTSSGLEAAMFGFLITLWVYVATSAWSIRKRLVALSAVSALLALTRPDGLLFVAVACVLVLLRAREEPNGRAALRLCAISMSPLAVVVAHEAWRIGFYGAWLPNTYYAKVVEAWPASGVRYAASYILEYCLWFPLLALVAFMIPRGIPRLSRADFMRHLNDERVFISGVIFAIVVHLGYYTLVVGGDHFEYRVYSYTIPLLFVAFAAGLNRVTTHARTALVLTIFYIVLAAPVPWTHYNRTRHLNSREETLHMYVPVAPAWPKAVRWYATGFDLEQRWLIRRSVCVRHQEHKVFWKFQVSQYPTRKEGMEIRHDEFAVHAVPAVGMPAWVYPHANIIDIIGLNDYVVARTPYPKLRERKMAHGRKAPGGYAASYRPNLTRDGKPQPRPTPLTAARITCLEHYWRKQLPAIQRGARKFDYSRVCAE